VQGSDGDRGGGGGAQQQQQQQQQVPRSSVLGTGSNPPIVALSDEMSIVVHQ
jgi:hypothetical protein